MPRISPWSISRRRYRSHEDNLQDREIRNAWHPGPPQRNRGITTHLDAVLLCMYSSIALNQVPASDGTLTRALRKLSCPMFPRAPTDRFELSLSRERGPAQSQPSSPHKRSGTAAPPLRPFGAFLGRLHSGVLADAGEQVTRLQKTQPCTVDG